MHITSGIIPSSFCHLSFDGERGLIGDPVGAFHSVCVYFTGLIVHNLHSAKRKFSANLKSPICKEHKRKQKHIWELCAWHTIFLGAPIPHYFKLSIMNSIIIILAVRCQQKNWITLFVFRLPILYHWIFLYLGLYQALILVWCFSHQLRWVDNCPQGCPKLICWMECSSCKIVLFPPRG